ncbi:type II secretion system F family protein [Burkholderia cenocepacia]|uniref:type II secretion system F family protein n=1 Tax=Burkholderia cepacia complex TaxID=87882 RepID=UPI000F587056|nr:MULTISPECIES: type II secretion system F family protein [Burkholderia cepacia complex]ELW9445712.1 type II secretion system F family protein [Burkholderia cenocepacia]MBR8481685.1 type II secretion system F family protein [Burkholderia cenocepacia]MDN7469321.1 type II secretion system F family protein [Burkholderia orbicola]MDN7503455.1 type II secretion system F family protein [Burkholderia orbicola]RQU10950.1 pilus assembly protein [Burkholderia cenocepacia]
MSAADLFGLGAFVVILAIGLGLSAVLERARQAPAQRIRERMRRLAPSLTGREAGASVAPGVALFDLPRRHGRARAWLQRYVTRVRAVGGERGIRIVIASTIAGTIAAIVVVKLVALPGLLHPLIYVGLPFIAMRTSYRALVERFRMRFLAAFPDAIDLIVRAVRAGIPVTQAISTVGDNAAEPVRSTFRTMGDSLRVGVDLKDVLTQAADRLMIADFSFFTVYLLLQRETGGSLGETLEELSSIIRNRRDIRLKTRALTAEGRITTKIISAVPFVMIGALFLVNRAYVMLLFDTHAGRVMLTVAAALLTIGLLTIHKMSKLDTAR